MIELKIENWEKGLLQAVIAQLIADKVYLAFWYKIRGKIDIKIFEKYGIGIIFVKQHRAEIFLEAKRSIIQKPYLKIEFFRKKSRKIA
ncbi:MAG: hypothetical protein ACTSVV_13160 [Promethearchaeota archaeon]